MGKWSGGSDALARDIIASAKEALCNNLESEFSWGCELCESPIERLFLAQLMHPSLLNEYDIRSAEVLSPKSGLISHVAVPPIPGLFIWPQIKIGDYRIDFIIGTNQGHEPKLLLVECDGHDFHEKTKEQAQRDKARDRYIVSQGYRLVRFTGSELHRDPFGAGLEALQILLDLR